MGESDSLLVDFFFFRFLFIIVISKYIYQLYLNRLLFRVIYLIMYYAISTSCNTVCCELHILYYL